MLKHTSFLILSSVLVPYFPSAWDAVLALVLFTPPQSQHVPADC